MIILHTITRGSGGGSMRALQKSISFERKLGHEVWIASGNRNNSDVNHLYVRHLKREISFFADTRAFLELRKIVATVNPDIVHSHESKAGALTRLLSFIFKTPVYVHTVHMATFHSKDKSFRGIIYSMIERVLAKKTDFLIFVSPALRNIFEAKKIRPLVSSLVIRSRVDIEKFAARRALKKQDHRNVTTQLGLPESSKIILFVGLLEPRKRPDFIINELASLLAEDSSIFLIFLGDGELRPHLERRAIELRISSKIRFLGSKSDVEIWVSGSDALVLASLFEGFPQIACQSAAAGTPIVATPLEEYMGSNILRIISSKESMAGEIVKVLSCSKSDLTSRNLELDEWDTKTIDEAHRILLDMVADNVRRRK